ncbi:pol-like protein [Moniliophthora roreri MCA 2997]|uniref:Pol-like protein n=1 Tax=Moniliophthora roreri (strain MCA 2997) TaxID=1381753 RepID=V2W297_MONRO|nr:pol-like protein [Moniliophthora roreri MCA 2997]
MTERCLLSYEHWKTGIITWRAYLNHLRSSLITGIWNTGGLLKTYLDGKHDGKTNTQADPLSHIPTFQVTGVEDNQGQVVLHPERFMRIDVARVKGRELEERICKGAEEEAEVLQAVEELKKRGSQRLINGLLEWEKDNGLVYYKEKLYISGDKRLCTDMLKQCYDALIAGHLGEHGTLEQVSCYYWWPGMGNFVQKYVQECEKCQWSKPAIHLDATLHLHDVPKGSWNVVGVDLVTELPESQGYDAIITYIDLYSKQVYVSLTITTLDAKGVADLHY